MSEKLTRTTVWTIKLITMKTGMMGKYICLTVENAICSIVENIGKHAHRLKNSFSFMKIICSL